MAVERLAGALFALLFFLNSMGQGLLERPVDVHANNVRLAEALTLIAQDGGFKLSYNAAALNGDSMVSVQVTTTAGKALQGVLGNGMRMVESGEHVILVQDRSGRERFTVQGLVVDATTGAAIPRASVYALHDRVAMSTRSDGSFVLEVDALHGRADLLIARSGYHDTVVYARQDQALGRIELIPREKLDYLEPICAYDRCAVEDLGTARLLVADAQMDAARNLTISENRALQFAVWPGVGTNGSVGGAFVNHASFNLFAGYAKGVKGAEFGVGVNIVRQDVKGVQFAGIANLTGRNTNGVQFAGVLNHTMRSLEGLQLAGFANTVWDTLNGVQVAGGANIVKGGMRGTQISGAANITTQACDGAQVSAGFNITVKEVRKAQVAGAVNYGRQVSGAQVTGGINVVLGAVGGGQFAGAINYARQVTGGQVAAGINVVLDTVIGGQVAVLNFARVCAGGQVGILNFSDTITGSSVGLLSVAWRGYHRFDVTATDVMPLTLTFRTGTAAFYNLLSYCPPVESNGSWGFGYGIGSEPRLGKSGALNIEITAEHVNEKTEWIDAVNILGRFSLMYAHTFGRRLVLSAGPCFNMLTSDWQDGETGAYLSSIAPSEVLFTEYNSDLRLQGWIGWRAGLGLRF